MTQTCFDVVIVGGGHNGLVAATLLGHAGCSVLVLERRPEVGGAAVSGGPLAAAGANVSRYAYLVSLFPTALLRKLGLDLKLRPRRVHSYTPYGERGLLVTGDQAGTRESFVRLTGDPTAYATWQRFYGTLEAVAPRLFATLLEPLRSRAELRRFVAHDRVWKALFEQPLSTTLEQTFSSDLLRGIVLTDATIGTFAPADDPELRQNRCFLYHVIGNGTGRWDVPVGGMRALTGALRDAAVHAGAELRTGAEVVGVAREDSIAEAQCADGMRWQGRHLLAGVAPAVLDRLLGHQGPSPEGSQLKINMLLARLPRLRDPEVAGEDAFAGTFHVNEGYEQLREAYQRASAGTIPDPAPCELYCHSLTDDTILREDLRAAGVQTLTLFGLHMPARLFEDPSAKQRALDATLRSVDSVLAEPLSDCLLRDGDGRPWLEALTPPELQSELGMPGGHIFHRDLSWPFAESDEEVGRWGVETEHPNVWICGAGARRGGGVSGIPGHNAAQAVLAAMRRPPRSA